MKIRIAIFWCAVWLVNAAEAAPLHIVGSIQPICAIARAVAGDDATVSCLVPAGLSPHDYALRPSEAKLLNQAQVVFWVGANFEGFLLAPLKKASLDLHSLALIALPTLDLLPKRVPCNHDHGHYDGDDHHHHHHDSAIDPHIWLSLKNAQHIATAMAEYLGKLDPEHAAAFKDRAKSFGISVQALAEKTKTELAPYQKSKYVVFHDAYQYFEAEFGLKGSHVLRYNPEIPMSIREIQRIRTDLSEPGLNCVFSEPQFNDQFLKPLLSEYGIHHAVLDPIGPANQTYEMLIEHLTKGFVTGLKQSD
ncbi:MAG: metal ABC transporter substrate-binding protein [Pseudomonadota bacterium]